MTATDAIAISGRDSQGQPSGLFSETLAAGMQVLVRSAERLTLSGGARLSSSAAGQGRGGALSVTATDAIVISGRDDQGQPSGLFSDTSGSGDAGSLFVSAPTLRMEDGGLMQAGSLIAGSGNAGTLVVDVGRLTLSGGAQLSSSTAGQGRGGALSVMATDAIVISGRDSQGQPSGLFSETSGNGDAGSLSVSAPRLTLSEGAQLSSSTAGQGQGGNLQVTAAHLQLSNGGTISASSSGTGNAGNVTILTQDFQSTNGSVTTQATQAAGGNIRITASHLVRLRDSKITAETGRGTDAGNIAITSQVVVLQNSQVTANAPVGLGGNIDIQAQVYLEDPASTVRASAPGPTHPGSQSQYSGVPSPGGVCTHDGTAARPVCGAGAERQGQQFRGARARWRPCRPRWSVTGPALSGRDKGCASLWSTQGAEPYACPQWWSSTA